MVQGACTSPSRDSLGRRRRVATFQHARLLVVLVECPGGWGTRSLRARSFSPWSGPGGETRVGVPSRERNPEIDDPQPRLHAVLGRLSVLMAVVWAATLLGSTRRAALSVDSRSEEHVWVR